LFGSFRLPISAARFQILKKDMGTFPGQGSVADMAGAIFRATRLTGGAAIGGACRDVQGQEQNTVTKRVLELTGPRPRRGKAAVLTALFTLTAGAALAASQPAAQYQIVHTFEGSDGSQPAANLTADKAGNLYGTTQYGGSENQGTVFQLAPDGAETVLYSFAGGSDGSNANGPVARDKAGNLYGETYAGGAPDLGTVFKIAPDGTETLLHTFAGGTNDGSKPFGGVVRDKSGNLYGTTFSGGASEMGTVYEIEPNGTMTFLHSFAGGTDGALPVAGLFRDRRGNLYGTTSGGGTGGTGTVFRLAPDGSETVLYSFLNGYDGGLPASPVIVDKAGDVYGESLDGGTTYNGVVYEVTPSGTEIALYSFTGGTDGGTPDSVLTPDKYGNLYGTTQEGGEEGGCGGSGCGVVFKLRPNGKETVLHTFTGGADGDVPLAGLIKVRDRATGESYLYGTSSGLGTKGAHGTIFQISGYGK
jgi:uncharacterized repeat protein (TIGR03803 family)